MIDFDLRVPIVRSHDGRSNSERAFIMRSMTTALRSSPPFKKLGDRDWSHVVQELEDRLDGSDGIRLVALDPEDPWLIIGFVLGGPLRLTYLHVRGGYRNLGVGRKLAEHVGLIPEGPECLIEFPTYDVLRDKEGDTMPIGLAHNPRYNMNVRPWMPPHDDRRRKV